MRKIVECHLEVEAIDLQDAYRQADNIQAAEGDPCDYYEVSARERASCA